MESTHSSAINLVRAWWQLTDSSIRNSSGCPTVELSFNSTQEKQHSAVRLSNERKAWTVYVLLKTLLQRGLDQLNWSTCLHLNFSHPQLYWVFPTFGSEWGLVSSENGAYRLHHWEDRSSHAHYETRNYITCVQDWGILVCLNFHNSQSVGEKIL